MAKLQELVADANAKQATKKRSKPTMSFTAGEPVIKETVKEPIIDAEPSDMGISAKKEIKEILIETVDESKVHSWEEIEALGDAASDSQAFRHPEPKEPNLKQEIREVKTATAVNASAQLPVEESKSHNAKPAVAKHPYHKNTNSNDRYVTKGYNKDLPDSAKNYPEHQVQIALLIKNNAEIRRFTAIGILNYLYQKGQLRTTKGYVDFKWNKFTIKADKLLKEYSYSDVFFLNCLAAAFGSFAASAVNTIDNFTSIELNKSFSELTTNEEIDQLVIK